MSTAYITHLECTRHQMSSGHPESPQRMAAIEESLRAAGLLEQLLRVEAPEVSDAVLNLAHDSAHIDRITALAPSEGLVSIDF